MEITIKMPKVWREILNSNLNDIIIPTGRISGKTKNTVIFATSTILANPYYDVVVTRSSYGSMADSLYAEFETALKDLPEEISLQFEFKKTPLRIERKGDSGTIYFIGSGGSVDRTKGLHTKHPVIMVIIDETQEFRTRENYDQFLASVRRNLDNDNFKVVSLGNPKNNEFDWFNLYVKECERDKDKLVCRMTWADIVPFLKDYDIKEILKCKLLDRDRYTYLYEGIPTGAGGKIYPMFDPNIHVVPFYNKTKSYFLQDYQIRAVICGVDQAVNHDETAICPMLVMNNGQMICAKKFIHNPLKDGVIGSFPLVEKNISRWFDELKKENNLDNPYDYYSSIPIIFVVDSAATEMIQALRYYLGNRAEVIAIKKGTILQMVDTVQSAIGKNVVGIYDYGGYYNYTTNQWVVQEDMLAWQLRALIWNEKQNGYDPIVPNDIADAFTYAVYFYYKQTENMIWLEDVVNRRKDYYILKNE